MDMTVSFEEAWPALDKRLRGALAGRRVPVDLRDDIVQETGLRLFRNWSHVRPESSWAFTLTIAINLVRDEMRRRERQDPSRLETPTHQRDAEQDALIRIELQRVRDAMAAMSERQRSILLAEIGETTQAEVEGAALKMARMRARRRLRSMLEQASGFVLLGFDRMRRYLGTSDPMLTGALSGMGRPAAVASIAAMGVLGAFGPDAAVLFNEDAFSSRPAQTITVAGAVAADEPLDTVDGRMGRDSASFEGSEAATHEEQESLVVDPDRTEIPPSEVEQEVAPATFGEDETRVGVRVRQEGAQCNSSQPASVCTGGGASATLEIAAGGEEHEATVGSGRVTSKSLDQG